MDNSLLNQILHEYELKRNKALEKAEQRKKELLAVNPRLLEIENELSSNSITASKAILMSNKKEQASILSDLKKKNTSLIKEKNAFIKNCTFYKNLILF